MNETLNIVSTAAALPNKQFSQFLVAFDSHQTFNRKAVHELESIVSLITNCLNSHEKKHAGLLLLQSFLGQCQLEIIEQKGGLWLSLCTKICAQRNAVTTICLSYEVANDILLKSVFIPDLGKAIANNLLSKLIESVNVVPSECHLAALKCLENCMKLYAGPSGASRGIIDRFIGNFIDSTSQELVFQSGKCLLQLQQIRGGSVQGTSLKSAWSNLQSQLLVSLHALLNQLFVNTTETYDGVNFDDETSVVKAVELNLSPEPIERTTQLLTRFKNLCEYIRIALCEPFPVAKAVQPGLVLSVISRGLAVNCATLLKNAIIDNVAVGALLPQVHVSLFRLLDSMILLLSTHLLPFANQICELAIQSLKWTSSGKAPGFKRPHTLVRQAAYNTLSLWCKTSKYGSLVESVSENLIKHIIQDITPYQSEVTLKVLAGSRKYLSKKARQKLHKAQNDASNISQTHSKSFNPHNTKIIYSDNGNEALCQSALHCLVHVLHAAGCFIKPLHQKILQENIISLALNIVKASEKPSNLYFNAECRKKLFEALFALTHSPHHLCPPPVQYAVEVFRIAQIHDVNATVRDECSSYLRGIEKILHPQKEVFFFPTNPSDVHAAFKQNAEDSRTVSNGLLDSGSELSSDDEEESDVEMDVVEVNAVEAKEVEVDDTTDVAPQVQVEVLEEEETPSKAPEPQTVIQIEDSDEEVELSPPQQEDTVKITVSDSPTDKALPSPPRKSARLSAKRHDICTEADSLVTKSESPLPRRRSTRLSSTSSQDFAPAKMREESATKRLSVIMEKDKVDAVSSPQTKSVRPESEEQKVEKDMVDELAAAFVEEFIDDEE